MNTIRVINVVRARPNLVKIAPLTRAMRSYPDIVPLLPPALWDGRASERIVKTLIERHG